MNGTRIDRTKFSVHTGTPRYLIRDRDRIYGSIVARRIRAMGIRDKPTAPASPWQNGFAERLIGSIRRECVDHFIVLGEAHLRHILRTYPRYYNHIRTHWSLDKDAPVSRSVQRIGSAGFNTITSGFRFSVHTALASSSPTVRCHCRHSNLGRTASSIRPDMIFGKDTSSQVVFRRQLKRRYVLAFFQKVPSCLVGMEACATSHHWSRELQALGHTVRLMPPAYVKPYVKRQKNDAVRFRGKADMPIAPRHVRL